MNSTTVVALGPTWVMLAGLFVPVITAAVTKYRADTSKYHALIAIALSAVLAVIAALTDDIPQDTLASIAQVFATAFIPALAAYLGFWQPVLNVNAKIAPDKGIGPADPPAHRVSPPAPPSGTFAAQP
jgi:hypothetical protein